MRILQIIAILLAGSLSASAGFNMPSKSFTTARVNEAMEAARADGKVITFMVSDTETREKVIAEYSKEIIQQMKADSVLVYVSDHKELPGAVLGLIEGKPVGNFIPFAIVTDAELKVLLGIVTATAIEDNVTRAFRPVKKAVKEHLRSLTGKPEAKTP